MTLEHYPGMAEAEIARHVDEANARWPLLGVTVIHRYGRLVPGDNVVLVVTTSSHREAAFAAAEFLMDYLKTRAPFWKKEERAGGDSWVEARQADDAAVQRWTERKAKPPNKPTGRSRRREGGTMIRFAAAGVAALLVASAAFANTQVSYFAVPKGAHPHDVATAPDGTVWYTAQHQGALGILDPKTGKTEQVPLGKGAAPHGVIAGPDGAAWITESGQNAIARVDPQSKAVKLFPLPKGFEKANLNTATFDKSGTLWFTGQAGIYGRARSGERQGRRLESAEGRWPLWHRDDARGRCLVRLARRRSHRAHRHRDRRRDRGRSAEAQRRPAPHLVGLQGHAVGELLARGRDRPLRSGGERLEESSRCRRARAAATRSTSTRRTRCGSPISWRTPSCGSIRSPRNSRAFPSSRKRASVRQMLGRAGRSVGRGIRHRPAGRDLRY